MERDLRIQKLKEIQEKGEPFQTGVRTRYKGEVRPLTAYKISLRFLVYNKDNGRIGSRVKTFEKQYHELDAEKEAHRKIIEGFLWDSKKDRNETTREDILQNGQLRIGIVTSDGIIIDGNRRALLLNKIWGKRDKHRKEVKRNIDDCQYFNAVILPEDADSKEIQKLETTYQMGEDEKLDYGPIEKYLKIKDLLNMEFSPSDIAEMMGEKESKIKEWIEIMQLMDQYLDYLGYNGIYTRLEKTEGPLVDLNNYLKKYKTGSTTIMWDYDKDLDVNEMLLLCFDYIRGRYEGKEFRKIAKPSKDSIFCKSKELWTDFLKEHEEKARPISEKTVEKLREESPDEDLSKLTSSRDKDWRDKTDGLLKGNLNKHYKWLEDMNDADRPLVLATRALKALQSINTEVPQFFEDEELKENLHEINRLTFEYMKQIKKHK